MRTITLTDKELEVLNYVIHNTQEIIDSGCANDDMLDDNEDIINMIEYKISDVVTIAESVLGTKLLDEEYVAMIHDWRAFVDNPERYRGSVVADMVSQWLTDYRNK